MLISREHRPKPGGGVKEGLTGCRGALGVPTDQNGYFFVPGIRFDNTPTAVVAHYVKSAVNHERGSLRSHVGFSKQEIQSTGTFDSEAQTWEVGDIFLSLRTVE